jgi:hypothetical protein
MRTEAASWEEQQRLLKAAKALADFANLEPDGVQSFRADHQDFVPTLWWIESNWNRGPGNCPWVRERDLLRKAWVAGFPADITLKLATASLFEVAHLLVSAGLPANIPHPLFTAHMLTGALDSVEGRASIGQAPNPRILAPDGTDITKEVKSRVESDQKIWSYQRAVLFLHVNSWRAKTCEWCGRRFIGEHSQARFCGSGTTFNACFWAWRKAYKKKKQVEQRDKINKRQRQKYCLEKRKRRSHRANRKNLRQR